MSFTIISLPSSLFLLGRRYPSIINSPTHICYLLTTLLTFLIYSQAVVQQEEGFPQQVAALATSKAIVDLSKPLEYDDDAISSSPGSLAINDMASSDSQLRAVMVLEGGKVVSSYTRDDVDPNEPFDVHSVTKGVITLLIGMLIDEGKLTLETILGDVFTDPSVWEGMEDAELRQNISVSEMIIEL